MASPIVDFRVRLPQPLRPAGSPLQAECRAQYDAILGLGRRRNLGLDALLGEMDEACDFPDPILVDRHARRLWVAGLAAVARKHPRACLEFGGLAPRYVTEAATGMGRRCRLLYSLLSPSASCPAPIGLYSLMHVPSANGTVDLRRGS